VIETETDLVDADIECRNVTLGQAQHNRRLDQVLVELVPEFSRSYLQQLIAVGAVSLNTKVLSKPAQRMKIGDQVGIELRPTPQSQAFKAESMSLDLVYQDAHLLVINKPAGLVVHPAPGNWSGTLMNGLLGFDPQAFMLPRAGIVHRLDKDTSGLMVVARTRGVMDALVKAIADRTVKRQYLALVHGAWTVPRIVMWPGQLAGIRPIAYVWPWSIWRSIQARQRTRTFTVWILVHRVVSFIAGCRRVAPIRFVCIWLLWAILWLQISCTAAVWRWG
jgi:23S rRNA-/tRNA-specific pseudouridylate synthase